MTCEDEAMFNEFTSSLKIIDEDLAMTRKRKHSTIRREFCQKCALVVDYRRLKMHLESHLKKEVNFAANNNYDIPEIKVIPSC